MGTGMDRRECHCPIMSLNVHVQVLWHTAAAISEKLWCRQLGCLPRCFAEQTAELAADRLRRQQQCDPSASLSMRSQTSGAVCSLLPLDRLWAMA